MNAPADNSPWFLIGLALSAAFLCAAAAYAVYAIRKRRK